MHKVMAEFKQFIMRGNMIDLAVGFVIGAAFGRVVTSLVDDILMPPLGLFLGKMDFSNLYVNLSPRQFSSLTEAKAAGVATINYGAFISTLIDLLIVAFALFLVIRVVNTLQRQKAAAAAPAPSTKECQYCFSAIPIKATRCPQCTSQLGQ